MVEWNFRSGHKSGSQNRTRYVCLSFYGLPYRRRTPRAMEATQADTQSKVNVQTIGYAYDMSGHTTDKLI